MGRDTLFLACACSCLPLAAAGQNAWDVREAWRVGPPAAEFAAVTDAALDGAGRLWIADGMSGELWVAEAGGSARRVATSGEGPGELAPGAVELVILPGDTILAIEPHTLRLHRFGPDGSYARTVTITGEGGMTGQWRLLPDGRLAARLYPATVRLPDATPGVDGDPVRAFDLEGRAGEVLAVLPPTESFRMGAGPMPEITLLAPQPLWAVSADGRVLVASTHAYRIRAHRGADSTVVVVRDAAAGRIGSAVEAKARELLREAMSQRRMPPPVVDQLVNAAAVAESGPVIGGLMAGPAGTVWVRLAATAGGELVDLQQPGGRTWNVHDAAGVAPAVVTLPAGFQPLEWRGDRLIGIGRDELGRTSAVVLRVTRTGA